MTVKAYPLDMKNLVASGYGNTLALSSGQGVDQRQEADADAPRFVLPEGLEETEGSIDGDEVFGGCGNIHMFFIDNADVQIEFVQNKI